MVMYDYVIFLLGYIYMLYYSNISPKLSTCTMILYSTKTPINKKMHKKIALSNITLGLLNIQLL